MQIDRTLADAHLSGATMENFRDAWFFTALSVAGHVGKIFFNAALRVRKSYEKLERLRRALRPVHGILLRWIFLFGTHCVRIGGKGWPVCAECCTLPMCGSAPGSPDKKAAFSLAGAVLPHGRSEWSIRDRYTVWDRKSETPC